MALSEQQSGVMKGIVIGAVVTVVAIVGAIVAHPFAPQVGMIAADPLSWTLRFDMVIAIVLAISIGRLARHRFFSPQDIDGGGLTEGSDEARVLQSILQNTLEQSVLAVSVHLAWAATVPPYWMSAIPVAVLLFVIGRLLFARSYRQGAAARALGFALTFYPSVLLLLLLAGGIVTGWWY